MYNEEIKQIRLERGFTQEAISKATGIPQNTISWIESKKSNGTPNIDQCIKLADFYGISLDELVGRDFKEEKQPTVNTKYYKCNF